MGLLPLDPSRVGQMRRVGCCLVYGSCCESRVFRCHFAGHSRKMTRTRFSAFAAFAVTAAGHVPGCLLRKGGDVPGKEVSSANGRLTSLPFWGRQLRPACYEPRFAGSRAALHAAR